PSITLENLHQVYLIDNSFSNLLFKYIIYIETTLKTKIAYNVANTFGEKQSQYLDHRKYVNAPPLDRQRVISKVTSEWEVNKNNHPIQHYKNNHSFTPPWIVVKGLYFGTTINWYKVLPQDIKKNIAQDYFKLTNLQDSDNQKEFLVII